MKDEPEGLMGSEVLANLIQEFPVVRWLGRNGASTHFFRRVVRKESVGFAIVIELDDDLHVAL